MAGDAQSGLSQFGAGLIAFLILYPSSASADCRTDSRGEVYCGAGGCVTDSAGKIWCSRHYDGGVKITLDGEVLCGIGRCARDAHGRVYCSSEVGGSVTTDIDGRVRCYGSCEPGSVDRCESTRADSAGG
jgi:hypothetical protein